MKRTPVFLLTLFVSAGLVWMTGCSESEDPSAVDDGLYAREQVIDLNDDMGGYNLADESPGFGDQALIDEFGDDDEFMDPMENHPLVTDRERDREGNLRGRIYLMVTWGNLHRDTTITDATDWSGGLSVDPGVVVLKRVIRFEPHDRILPRTDPGLLTWESHTLPGIDGIVVRIAPCTSDGDPDAEPDSSNTIITFETEPFSTSFSLRELPGLNRIVTLDDGNAVAFNAVYVPPITCANGFLRGVWRNNPDRPGGDFFGKYVDQAGFHRGFVRGHYGVNSDGKNVFFGKWISRTGKFMGILRGTYDTIEDERAGMFAGHWIGRDRRIEGVVGGEWRRHDECRGGFFRGRWKRECRLDRNTI
ncbi:MAG: hypothetical protein JSW50_06765 [Candidatus Latescibacterota bacterium]|nr:MAG: hypothetical protein JSW50_06765 [Candidatus Latescibacterota bacterium]